MRRVKGGAPAPAERLRVGVSACLLGHEVRHDGGHKRDAFLVDTLGRWVEWVPFCPEVELGLGVPREPIRLEGDARTPRLAAPRSGTDHTEAMARLAARRVAEIQRIDLDGYVVKKDSPSCGMERVRVWRGTKMPARSGVGAFTRVLMERMPVLPVEEEGRLGDPALRENFVERLFAHRRWRGVLSSGLSRGALVRFHTAHKPLVLAHEPAAYQRLGRLVARLKGRPLPEVAREYGRAFMAALRVRATPGRHANVLEHMLGYLSDGIGADERREIVELIADHRRGLVPLVVPLTLIRHHVRRLGVEYLAAQVYLEPTAKELMLRNHV